MSTSLSGCRVMLSLTTFSCPSLVGRPPQPAVALRLKAGAGQDVDSTAWAHTELLPIDRDDRDPAAWIRLTVAIDNLSNPKGTTAP
jgi:hypothetical protein